MPSDHQDVLVEEPPGRADPLSKTFTNMVVIA